MRIKVLSGGRKSIELPLSDAELNFQMKRIGIEEIVRYELPSLPF